MKNSLLILLVFFLCSCDGETKTKATNTSNPVPPKETVKSNPTPDMVVSSKGNDLDEKNETTQPAPTTTTTANNSSKNNKTVAQKQTVKKATVGDKNLTTKNEETQMQLTDPPKNPKSKPTSEVVKKDIGQMPLAQKEKMEAEKTRILAEKMKAQEEAQRTAAANMKKTDEAKAKMKEKLQKAKEQSSSTATKKPEAESLSHDTFNALLQKHVSSSGKVSYKGFKNDEAKLDAYIALLGGTKVENSWSRNKKMAFWINAYNANTIKLILKNYPVTKITDLHGGKPWDVKWIKIDNRTLSLNNIENDILRPKYNEPRIHFAVNCAAQSCPPLLNKAWTEGNLNSTFDKQAKAFINNSKYNKIGKNSAEVSKIFDWYGKDFGNLVDYLNKYADTKIASGTTVKFKEYDWSLNN